MSAWSDDPPVTPGGRPEGEPADPTAVLAARVADVTRLAEIGAPVSRMVDIQPVLADVLRTVVEVVRADRGVLALFDADSGQLSLAATTGFATPIPADLELLRPGDGPAARALAGGRAVVGDAAYVVPLVTLGAEVMGLVAAYWDAPHRPDARERRLVEGYARQAAGMIERARLHGEARRLVAREQRRARQLCQLAEAAMALSAADDARTVLGTVAGAAREIVGTHQAFAARFPDDPREPPGTGRAHTATSLSERYAEHRDAVPPLGWHDVLAKLMADQRPIRLTRGELAGDADRAALREPASLPPLVGYLGVPLVGADGVTLGVVHVSEKSDGTEFSAEDEAVLVQLAQLASATVERLDSAARDRAARAEAERVARRYRLLSEASKQFSASLELSEALRTIARLVVPSVAEWCAFDLVSEPGLVRAHVEAAGPDIAERMRQAQTPGLLAHEGAHGAPAAIRTGRSLLYASVSDDVLRGVASDDVTLQGLRAADIRSALVVPLRARGEVIGAVSLLRFSGPAYTPDDLGFVEELAARAAQAIDNASRFTFERNVAASLQRSLLPHALPVAPGIDVASRYLPGASGTQVGGDWYDLIDLGSGRLGLVVGDVMGRGIAAATVMGQLRATVRAYALDGHEPAELLRRLDRVVQALGESQLTTCVYGVYDASTRDLTLASAGHLPPLLIDDAGPRYLELEPGLPLGVGDAAFGQTRVGLSAGATVLLYTDGLVEGRDCPIAMGMERLLTAAGSAPPAADQLCDHVLRALGRDGDHDDDTALLAVSLASGDRRDPRQPRELSLSPEPGSAAEARSFVARVLRERGLERYGDVAVLLVSELVTNALRHARTEIRLRVASGSGRLRVEVVDGSGQVPLPRHAIPDQDESGRGMVLVAGLSDRWGTEPGFGGKCVWFELDV